MEDQSKIWPKHITVDKRIVKILSESTYDNFPNALKEILTNSYDADSSEVRISINLKKEIIVIEDNGKGMSEREFEYFTRIAGVKREKEGGTTNSGRRIIGKFGVGFLSIFPFFKNYTIETTKKGSSEILYASIPCYQYFSAGKLVDVNDIPIQGEVRVDSRKQGISYTKITLTGFTSIASAFFHADEGSKHRKYSVKSFGNIERLKWKLEEDLPLEYEDNRFSKITRAYSPNIKFKVFLNNIQLLRRVYAKQILESNKNEVSFNRVYSDEKIAINENQIVKIGRIKFHYFILTDKQPIHPYEARGLKIRNLNAGVGERESFGLGSEVKGARSRLQWLTGEVLILEGMNELISVSRDKFYYDPDYEEFKEFFIKRLSHHSNQLESEVEYIREENDPKIKNLGFIEEEPEENSSPTPVRHSSRTKVKKQKGKIAKTISLQNKDYTVSTSQWDYKNSFYPAVKLENSKLIINKKYPLFKGVKYNDIFIKLHAIFIINHQNGFLDKKTFSKLSNDILIYYKDYQKL